MKNKSKYFSRSGLARLPVYKVIISSVLIGALVISTGAGVAYAMLQPASQPEAVEAEPLAATPTPTPTPTPEPTPTPISVYLSATSVQQDIGVEVYTLEFAKPSSDELIKVPVLEQELTVRITAGGKEPVEYPIDTQTGTLLVEDVEPGDYTVELLELPGYEMPRAQTVTVKQKIEYKATKEEIKKVADKVVQAGSVVEAVEDNHGNGQAEQLVNTVQYADSKEETVSVSSLVKVTTQGEYMVLKDGTVTDYVPVYDENGSVIRAVRRTAAGAPILRIRLMETAEGVESQPETAPTAEPEESPLPSQEPESTPTSTPEETPTPTPTPTETPEPTPSATPEPVYKSWPDSIDVNQFGSYSFQFSTEDKTATVYTGWQTIGGNTYYYDPTTHQPVTGSQVINGVVYTFSESGAMKAQRRGIDVSKFQSTINWSQVKAAGIDFAIIRVGYRGATAGALVEDSQYRANIRGATAAGIPVGLYFYSQAINEEEAREEALMVLSLCGGYRISYPIYYDTENFGGGRADKISAAQRTACAIAFCETIRSAGYTAGVYSYASWFYNNLNFSNISKYPIWIAQYRDKLDFKYGYSIWQYTGSGRVPGISTAVDMNIAY